MSIGKVLGEMTREITRVHKQADENKRLTVNNPLNMGRISRQTIAAGSVNVTRPFVGVIPESGTSDNLDEITNLSDGKMVVISPADLGDTITVRDYTVSGTGNISLTDGTSIALATQEDSIILVYREVIDLWIQVGGGGSGSVATPLAHASTHQHGGSDEVATATPGANAIPKAGAGGTLATGWYDVGAAIDGSAERVSLSLTDKFGLAVSGVLNWASYQTLRDTIKSYYDSVVATLTNKTIDAGSNTITNINTSSLANDAVSNAKLANMAADTIKGRANGGGTGDPQDLTPIEVMTILAKEFPSLDAVVIDNLMSFIVSDQSDSGNPKSVMWGDILNELIAEFDPSYANTPDNFGAVIHYDAVEKLTIVAADEIAGVDSASVGADDLVRWKYSTIRDTIKSYYDSVVATLTNKSIDASTNTLTNINTSALADDAVSNAKLANMAEATIKGRAVGAGTGDPTDLTATQLQAILETLATYIRADGTRPLTANWDAGTFAILLTLLQARSSSGLQLRTDDGLLRWQLADDGRVIHYADDGAGGSNDHIVRTVNQPASVTRLQTVTITLVSVAAVLVWNTHFDIGLARNGNTAVFGWATGRVTWQNQNTAIPANILSSDLASDSSGTTTVTVTAINNGIEIEFGNGDFLNTLDRNSVVVTTYGYDAIRPAVTITIA